MIPTNKDAQNKILKAHGYYWRKITQDWLDDNDDFETVPGWHLYAADGREVSVSRAFAEIERGVDVVAAEVKADQDAAQREAERQAKMDDWKRRLAQIIMRDGTRPDGDNNPQGERLLDTQDIYGGGDWFVMADDRIWYVKNNGMDGDNWSYNNVRTGGAGAIGWFVPMDTDIEDALLALAKNELPTIRMF